MIVDGNVWFGEFAGGKVVFLMALQIRVLARPPPRGGLLCEEAR
jgi:hypothetical protein